MVHPTTTAATNLSLKREELWVHQHSLLHQTMQVVSAALNLVVDRGHASVGGGCHHGVGGWGEALLYGVCVWVGGSVLWQWS